MPFNNNSLPDKKLRQRKDGADPNFASRKEHNGKYLALNTRKNRNCWLSHSLQHCFDNRVVLNIWRFWNPIPPSSFAVQSLSHFNQWIFLLSVFCPHQYWAIRLFTSSHHVLGRRKQFIMYVGIACATAFIRISLPAFERNFSFHPWRRCTILSFMPLKIDLFDLPMRAGRPRYLSKFWTPFDPQRSWIDLRVAGKVFGLKKIAVFSL